MKSHETCPVGLERTGSPIRLVFAMAVVLACVRPVGAQQLSVRTYGVAEGLPGDDVLCLVADRDGFLWICTKGGLARFDGSVFTSYGTEDGLPDPVANNLLHARSGNRWVATNGGGVARLELDLPNPEGRTFRAFDVGGAPRSRRVNVLFETQDGTVLAGTDGGLFAAREADREPHFERIPLQIPGSPDGGLQIWAIADGGAERTWLGTSAGLVRLRDGEPPVRIPVAPVQGADHVWAIATDAAGRLWLGHETGLVVWAPPTTPDADLRQASAGALADGATPCVATGDGSDGSASLPESVGRVCRWRPGGGPGVANQVWGLMQTPDGSFWLASAAGLARFDGERVQRFPETRGMVREGYHQIAMDRGGDLWTGSGRGAHRIVRRGFARFTRADGLEGSPSRFFRGPDGEFYAVAPTSTIYRLDGGLWTAVRPKLPPAAGTAGRSRYGAVLLDRSGRWWVGTGGGLLRFPAVKGIEELAYTNPVARFTTEDGLAGDDIYRLFEDVRGDVWIASRIPIAESLTRWERRSGRFHRYGAAQGLPLGRTAAAFAEDASGTLWVSFFDGGLARFDGERFQFFASGASVPAGTRPGILFDSRGWLWLAGRRVVYATDPGARNPGFRTYHTAEGTPLRGDFLGEDAAGRIYAGSPGGLVRFRPDDGRLQRLGLLDVSSPFHRDGDGKLWLSDAGGVLRYDPSEDRDVESPPPVWIGGISVGGAALPVPAMGATSLPPQRVEQGRQVRIEYFGLGFGTDESLRYQVRLEGANDEWSRPISDRSVRYAGLGPGHYRFQVRAVGASGAVTPEPATVAFTVPPPLWRRAWFVALLGTGFAALLVGAHRLRVRRLLELERVRTRIAADLHDDLGASLARVSLLTEAVRRRLRDPEAAERMLAEIGETSRRLVSDAGDIAFSIDPGRGTLAALAARVRRFAEELLIGTGIDWILRVDGDPAIVLLSSDQRRHLLAILKEGLHNAVRHGRPARISLTFAVRSRVLEIELTDDGLGFDADAPDGGGGGKQGLANLRRRADELGAALRIESDRATGTRLSLVVPL